jgi:arylsulfatase
LAALANIFLQTDSYVKATVRVAEEAMDEAIRLSSQVHDVVNRELRAPPFLEPTKPLNILLLYADDWRHDSLGSAGTQVVMTPFLDRLAKEGVRFTHNCVTTSVCWISRATLHTGQWLSRHNSSIMSEPNWYKNVEDSFPEVLRRNGYYTGHIGKWNMQKDDKDFVGPTFDYYKNHEGAHWFEDEDNDNKLTHVTKLNEKHGLKFLQERPRDKPFHLTVAFYAPHCVDSAREQYFPQPESMKLYKNLDVPVPFNAGDDFWDKLPPMFTQSFEGRLRYFMRFDTPSKYQKMMKNYYRLITEVDNASENLVNELKAQGILNETVVIFTTDNGYFHAEHGIAGKWLPYEESIRVPLIIQDPRMHPRYHGTLNDDFTLSVDLASTILAAAGLSQPDRMQGRDISELYRGSGVTDWRNEFFYEHPDFMDDPTCIPTSKALVRKDFKYIEYPDFNTTQLFHIAKDPFEENDLITNPDYAPLIESMQKRLRELEEEAK